MTIRLVEYIQRRSISTRRTFISIAEEVGLDSRSVRNIFTEYLDQLDATRCIETPGILGIDELHVLGAPRAIFTNLEANTIIELLVVKRDYSCYTIRTNVPHVKGIEMQDINWNCCPLVALNPIVRSFIEQIAKERKSPSTVENYARDLNDFLTAFANTSFPELLEADESQIADYVDWLWKRDAYRGSGHKADRSSIRYLTGSKLAPATIRRHISTLRSFYRWSIRLRHRSDPINPVREGVRGQERGLVSLPSSAPWIPDEQQWKAILRYVLTKLSVRDQTIVLLAHDGALRREELVLLSCDDIDWRTHTIAIRAERTKNHLPGIIVLSHPTFIRLKEYIEGDRAALIACYGADRNGPIFLSDSQRNPGQPITKWTVKDIFDRIRNELHIPQLTPHKMRHLMLTELKKSGMDLLDVSRYGRHRRVASTEIYLHTDLSDLAREVNKAHHRLEKLLEQMQGEEHDPI
jgi:integrase/recombinase XerD